MTVMETTSTVQTDRGVCLERCFECMDEAHLYRTWKLQYMRRCNELGRGLNWTAYYDFERASAWAEMHAAYWKLRELGAI